MTIKDEVKPKKKFKETWKSGKNEILEVKKCLKQKDERIRALEIHEHERKYIIKIYSWIAFFCFSILIMSFCYYRLYLYLEPTDIGANIHMLEWLTLFFSIVATVWLVCGEWLIKAYLINDIFKWNSDFYEQYNK